MNVRRRPARRRLLGRALDHGWLLLAGALGLVGLMAGSVTTHRLDSLSKQRVRLENELESARHDLVRAQSQYASHSAYEVVVRRARNELGLVECAPASQLFLAMPRERDVEAEQSWLGSLAARIDRFANVRGVLAAERERR